MTSSAIKLSHHEKRLLATRILAIAIVFVIVMAFGGALYHVLGIIDPVPAIWLISVSFIAVGMFGFGYIVRDKLPSRMGTPCKRFYFMGHEFGIWHWSRAQIYLADIFLVSLPAAVYGWAASNTIPLLAGGIGWFDVVPLLYIPILYVPFLIEFLFEGGLIFVVVFGFIYEVNKWILHKNADFCYFEGARGTSSGMKYDCDPSDPSCPLNKNFG